MISDRIQVRNLKCTNTIVKPNLNINSFKSIRSHWKLQWKLEQMRLLLWIIFSCCNQIIFQVCLRKISSVLGTLRSLSRRGGWEFPAIQLQKITCSYFYVKTVLSLFNLLCAIDKARSFWKFFLETGNYKTRDKRHRSDLTNNFCWNFHRAIRN